MTATWKWYRIVNATIKPVSGGKFYDISIEATPTGQDADGPPAPPYDGSAFAGAQLADGNLGDLVWDYSGDTGAPGFNLSPTVGPLSVILADGVYTQLTTSVPIVVRVSAAAGFAAVFSAGGHATLTCTSSVNGIIGTGSLTSAGGGFLAGAPTIELPTYTMVAGEVLTFSGGYTGVLAGGGWGSSANDTFIRIGRGTQHWGSGGSAEVWVGP